VTLPDWAYVKWGKSGAGILKFTKGNENRIIFARDMDLYE